MSSLSRLQRELLSLLDPSLLKPLSIEESIHCEIRSFDPDHSVPIIFCRDPGHVLFELARASTGGDAEWAWPPVQADTAVRRAVTLAFLLGENIYRRVPHGLPDWPGAACVYADTYSDLRRRFRPERLFLMSPPVLPHLRIPRQRETSCPREGGPLLLFCETVQSSHWMRQAASAVWPDGNPVFLILPPSFSQDGPVLLAGGTERELSEKEALDLASQCGMILYLPPVAFREREEDALGILACGPSVIARPNGWWGELPEGSFIPFDVAGEDASALTTVLKMSLRSPGFLAAIAAKAQNYAQQRGSAEAVARDLSRFLGHLGRPDPRGAQGGIVRLEAAGQ